MEKKRRKRLGRTFISTYYPPFTTFDGYVTDRNGCVVAQFKTGEQILTGRTAAIDASLAIASALNDYCAMTRAKEGGAK